MVHHIICIQAHTHTYTYDKIKGPSLQALQNTQKYQYLLNTLIECTATYHHCYRMYHYTGYILRTLNLVHSNIIQIGRHLSLANMAYVVHILHTLIEHTGDLKLQDLSTLI